MPKLFTFDGYKNIPSKPDPIFRLKELSLNWTIRLLDYRTYAPDSINSFKGFDPILPLINSLDKSYKNLMNLISLDDFIWEKLMKSCKDKQGDYYCVQFNPFILSDINKSHLTSIPLSYKERTYHVSPPLYYDQYKIKTLISKPFWAKIEKDIFGHSTIIVNEDDTDSYFGYLKPKNEEPQTMYPVFAQPFLGFQKEYKVPPLLHRWAIDVREEELIRKYGFSDKYFESLSIEDFFALYETNFTTQWNTLKGLLHYWGKMDI
jgi:hypothetical protein